MLGDELYTKIILLCMVWRKCVSYLYAFCAMYFEERGWDSYLAINHNQNDFF
jgi:hypothetical protein